MRHPRFTWAQAFALSWRAYQSARVLDDQYTVWAQTKVSYERVQNNLFNRSRCGMDLKPELVNRRYRIWQRHLKHRRIIVRAMNVIRVNKECAFIMLSFLLAFVGGAKYLVADIIRAYRKIELPIDGLKGSVDLAIRFPHHSFAASGTRQTGQFCALNSLGEYLHKINSKKIVVVEGYTRSIPHASQLGEECGSLNLIQTRNSLNFLRSTKKLCLIIGFAIKSRREVDGVLDRIETLRMHFRAAPYLDLCERIDAKCKINNIFVMPIADLGIFIHAPSVASKICVYNYSSNNIVPPFPKRPTQQRSTSSNYLVFHHAMYQKTKVIGFQFPGFAHATDNANPQNQLFPTMLGYISIVRQADKIFMKKRYVVIYDNPFEDFEQTLGEKLCGDLNVSKPLLTDFLRSAVNVCLLNGLDVVLKPKYAISRYPKFYGDLIKSIVTDARGKVRVLDPYVKQEEIVRSALLTINFPYTSSKAFSEALGVASVFFLPIRDGEKVFASNGRYAVISNEPKLSEFICSLKKNQG